MDYTELVSKAARIKLVAPNQSVKACLIFVGVPSEAAESDALRMRVHRLVKRLRDADNDNKGECTSKPPPVADITLKAVRDAVSATNADDPLSPTKQSKRKKPPPPLASAKKPPLPSTAKATIAVKKRAVVQPPAVKPSPTKSTAKAKQAIAPVVKKKKASVKVQVAAAAKIRKSSKQLLKVHSANMTKKKKEQEALIAATKLYQEQKGSETGMSSKQVADLINQQYKSNVSASTVRRRYRDMTDESLIPAAIIKRPGRPSTLVNPQTYEILKVAYTTRIQLCQARSGKKKAECNTLQNLTTAIALAVNISTARAKSLVNRLRRDTAETFQAEKMPETNGSKSRQNYLDADPERESRHAGGRPCTAYYDANLPKEGDDDRLLQQIVHDNKTACDSLTQSGYNGDALRVDYQPQRTQQRNSPLARQEETIVNNSATHHGEVMYHHHTGGDHHLTFDNVQIA